MTDKAKYDRHAKLVDRMADSQGVDLSEAVQRGDISPEELDKSVFTCLGCSETEACERWLAVNSGGADATPGYCRNEAVFDALRPVKDTS